MLLLLLLLLLRLLQLTPPHVTTVVIPAAGLWSIRPTGAQKDARRQHARML